MLYICATGTVESCLLLRVLANEFVILICSSSVVFGIENIPKVENLSIRPIIGINLKFQSCSI
jgi:hypothetical protein